MGLISRTVERLEDSLSLLAQIMATFEVNKNRVQWTGEELKAMYSFYEKSWKPRYDEINGLSLPDGTKGGPNA